MANKGPAHSAVFVHTNVFVRLLTNDPPAQAKAAERALDAAGEGNIVAVLTDIIFAELAYVLTEVYELGRADAADRLQRILDLPGLHVSDEEFLRGALELWKTSRLDFADAHLAALAVRIKDAAVLSFDKDFDRLDGVTRLDPTQVGV